MPFDKSKLIGQFKAETKEHIQRLNQGLLRLERAPTQKRLLQILMQEAHTIKGAATMMEYKRIVDIAHNMEAGLARVLDKKVKMKKAHFELFFQCLDTIEGLLEDKVTWKAKGIVRPFVEQLCKKVAEGFPEQITQRIQKKTEKQGPVALVSDRKLSERSLSVLDSIRVDINKLDRLMNLCGELVISKIRLNELVSRLAGKTELQEDTDEDSKVLIKELKKATENLHFSSSNMQSEVMNLRMIPIAYLFNAFPRTMRDLAHQRGKALELEISGEQTELDKSIIDQMKDPLMHLLRNALDHGIEEPKVRQNKNKPKTGKIILKAYQKGSQVIIEIADDGGGIDLDKIKKQAVKKGIISQEKLKEMVDEQLLQLLFTPGFSTKDVVSQVSGRGIGLNIVRDKVAKLKGIIEVESKPNAGTKFLIRLPLTLAITDCLLVASGTEIFALPIDTVVETIRISAKQINTVETNEVITVKGHIIPLLRLNEIFGLSLRGIFEKRFFSVVIVQSVEKRTALLVDMLLGRQEIVSRPLGEPLKNVKAIAAGTVMGDGRVVLILDIPAVIKSAEGRIFRPAQGLIERQRLSKERKKKILLAEDVLSTALLEKNILESANFSVVIAHNGEQALNRANQERFNLVITDILMPKMDGFELTMRLKKDRFYKDIPVIILTTRESDAEKRRGLQAGAEAYILKSEFTAEDFVDTVERLIG